MSRDWSIALRYVRTLQFFDVLFLIYISVFVRQYFWIISNNRLAWLLTEVVSLGLLGLYVVTREVSVERPPPALWLIIGLPLLFIYILRAGYPDLSFDVLNYHIFHGERALRGLLEIAGDFAPASFPFYNNPAPDMITGLFRLGLGFRLGTVVNYLALLWTGSILFRFLGRDIRNYKVRSIAVLLVLFSEQLLWEINNYMVDLLALPILLEAAYLTLLQDDRHTSDAKRYVFISLLLGASVALKLTNLVFALPLGLVALRNLVATKPQKPLQLLTTTGAMAVSFILPLLPHTTYLYYVTSNPVFPLYNKIFQSPLWSYHNTFDVRWGPQGVWQTIFWPFRLLIKHDRVSELNLYSGRLTLGLFALFLLLLFKRERRVSQFGFVMVTSSFLWSLGTGYMRYGLCLEIFGGISLVLLANQLWKSGWASRALRQAAFGFVCLVLFTQSILAAVYSWDREWGGRPVGFLHPKEYRRELGELFSDRSLTKYLTSEQMDLFKGVEGLVEAGTRTSAVTSMLRPDLPQLNIFSEPFLATPAAMRKFRTAKSLLDHKILLSVVLEEDLELAIDKLQKRGYASTKATRLQLPFFSNERYLRLVVLQITGDPSGRLGHSIFHAQITVLEGLPERMKAGEQVALRVKVKNFSGGSWPAEKSGKNQVTLGNKWLNESGGILVEDDGRTALPNDLPPGAEIELNLKVRAPLRSGDYILFLDLVQEQVSWFYEQGSTPFEAPIRVER